MLCFCIKQSCADKSDIYICLQVRAMSAQWQWTTRTAKSSFLTTGNRCVTFRSGLIWKPLPTYVKNWNVCFLVEMLKLLFCIYTAFTPTTIHQSPLSLDRHYFLELCEIVLNRFNEIMFVLIKVDRNSMYAFQQRKIMSNKKFCFILGISFCSIWDRNQFKCQNLRGLT